MQPFPSTGHRWQVSSDGGTRPFWLPGGGIAYLHERDVMTVAIAFSPAFRSGAPVLPRRR